MSKYPFPSRVGSDIVASNSIRILSKDHSIDLICFQGPEDKAERPNGIFQNIEWVGKRRLSKVALAVRYLFGMFTGIPFSVSMVASWKMQKKVRDAVAHEKYDCILLFELNAIQYCPEKCYGKMIVNIEDPLAIKFKRMASLDIWSLWQKSKLYVQGKLAANYEQRILPKMGKVLLLSESDMNDMRQYGGYKNLSCMPYGVTSRNPKQFTSYKCREKAIVVTGNMFHPPNVDGLLFFLREVFPLVIQEYPASVLWIVGANPDVRIYTEARKFGKKIVITGWVDDVAEYIKRSCVSICPVRLKIGVQTKILEALSWGTPVVTTSAGNSGIQAVSGRHIWVEDDPVQFARRVVELLQGNQWEKLSKEGRTFVIEHFSWERSASLLDQQMKAVAASNP